MTSVLIGEISSYKAIVIARYIKKNYPAVRVVSFDTRGFTKFLHTRFTHKHYLIKANHTNTLIGELSKLISEEKITWFFPVHSDSIAEYLKHREQLSDTLAYMGSLDDYLRLHNKLDLPALSKKAGLRVPMAFDNIAKAVLPAVVKPATASSAKNVSYIRTEEDRRVISRKNLAGYVVQEYVDGFGCGFSAFVKDGKIIQAYGHKREAEFPVTGGSSVYRSGYEHPQMREVATKILNEIKWSGFIMFEFKVNANNELFLIEINPRIWGSIHQGLANNCNFFESILGPKAGETDGNSNFTTYLAPQVFYALMRYTLKGNLRPLKSFMSNGFKNKSDLAPMSDPFAWLSAVLRFVLK